MMKSYINLEEIKSDDFNEYDKQILYQRCYAGDIYSVRNILELHAALIDSTDAELFYYTIRGKGNSKTKISILESLEEFGVSLRSRSDFALQKAVMDNNLEVVQFLLSKNLDANQQEGILLYYAAMYADDNVFSLLLNSGATLDTELAEDINELQISGNIKEVIDEYLYIRVF